MTERILGHWKKQAMRTQLAFGGSAGDLPPEQRAHDDRLIKGNSVKSQSVFDSLLIRAFCDKLADPR
jgi:hypothetical protein